MPRLRVSLDISAQDNTPLGDAIAYLNNRDVDTKAAIKFAIAAFYAPFGASAETLHDHMAYTNRAFATQLGLVQASFGLCPTQVCSTNEFPLTENSSTNGKELLESNTNGLVIDPVNDTIEF